MADHNKNGFFADPADLNMEDYLVFEYAFESVIDPEEIVNGE